MTQVRRGRKRSKRPSVSRKRETGGQRPTVYDLARACGVSIATVSRVINGQKYVHPRTRERVSERMRELGYQPSQAARTLSTGRTQVISVWIGNLSSHLVMAFLAHLEQHLTEADFEMLLRNLWHRPLEEVDVPVNADGIIVFNVEDWVERLAASEICRRIPVVNVGTNWYPHVDHVGMDLTNGVREALAHLFEVGCQRIAYLSPRKTNLPTDTRYQTYLACMAEAERPAEIIGTLLVGDRDLVEEALDAHIERYGCPDGLLCHNDDHAIAACRTLRRRGIRIPQDVAVIGCNGLQETEYLECPVSTIVLPIRKATMEAWRLLYERMRNREMPIQSVVLHPHLAVRASSRRNGF